MNSKNRRQGHPDRTNALLGATLGLVFVAGLTAIPHPACAQNAPSGRSSYKDRLARPTVSPYLNLYRNDSTVFPNYQTLVRPQLQQRAAINAQQREISQLQSQVAAANRRQALPATGHPSRFRYFSHYYGQRPNATQAQK